MSSGVSQPPIAIAVLPAVMMLVAIAPLPYGYYQLLRLVVAVAGIWIAYAFWDAKRVAVAIAVGVTVLVFNPLAPVHFDRETWTVLNVVGALVFSAAAWMIRRTAQA